MGRHTNVGGWRRCHRPVLRPEIRMPTPQDTQTSGISIRNPLLAASHKNNAARRGSCSRRWQSTDSQAEKQQLAEQLQQLLTSSAPKGEDRTQDAELCPTAHVACRSAVCDVVSGAANPVSRTWGLDPALFGKHPDGTTINTGGCLCVRAPYVIAIRLPADLVANSEFVTTGDNEQQSRPRAVFNSTWRRGVLKPTLKLLPPPERR